MSKRKNARQFERVVNALVCKVPGHEFNAHQCKSMPKREVDRLEVLACRCLRRELRRVIIQRNGGHLPTLPRYVRRKRRRHRRPPLQPFTGPSPPSSPPGDNPPPSTSSATLVSPQGSTLTAPSARISNSSSFSTLPGAAIPYPSSWLNCLKGNNPSFQSPSHLQSSSSPRQHRLPTNSGLENGVGGGEYDNTDELDGVRPFTSPNPPHRSSPPPPIRPPSEASQLLSGILGGGTIDVNTAGSSSTTASEQMDFIEMISRNFLYCRMLAKLVAMQTNRRAPLFKTHNQIDGLMRMKHADGRLYIGIASDCSPPCHMQKWCVIWRFFVPSPRFSSLFQRMLVPPIDPLCKPF
ncbi:hypothetical protein ACTXT7_009243 [Hymenolepis weldensis]